MMLLYCDKNGKVMMDPEGMAALQLIKGPLIGPSLARLKSFADAINSGTVPTLSPSRQSVREAECGGRPYGNAVDIDKAVVRKRKLEELRRLEQEEAEIRSRKKKVVEQNMIRIEECKEKLRLLDEQYKKDYRELQDLKGALS